MTSSIQAAAKFFLLSLVLSVAQADFCWKNTYGRGVGTIPTVCESGHENSGGFCYPKCQSGYKGVGPVCWQWCPDKWTDHGVGCTKPAPYGRGGGYPWKFGDSLNDSGMKKRCEGDHGKGNCEKNGLMYYPKCKSGFWAVACCICSPNCPKGFTDSGATCMKSSYGRGVGKVPTGCADNKVNDAGFCYKKCEKGTIGVGPVCWGHCPNGWHDCLAGCANPQSDCLDTIKEQTMSVVDVVSNAVAAVGTGGASAAAKMGVKAAAKAAMKKLAKKLSKKQLKDTLKKLAKKAGKEIKDQALDALSNAAEGNDFEWSDLDPTGIVDLVKSFKKEICH